MSEEKTAADTKDPIALDGVREWVVKLDDDRELVVFADDMLQIERPSTGARTLLFENSREQAVAALRLTGDAQKEWPKWHVKMRWMIAVKDEDKAPPVPTEEAAE